MRTSAAMIILLLVLFAFSQFGYGKADNLKLRFFARTGCFGCEETVIVFRVDFFNDVNSRSPIMKNINIAVDGPEFHIDLPEDVSVLLFQWGTLIISENEVCCWTIDEPELVVEMNNGGITENSTFRKNMTLCYSGTVFGNNSWICPAQPGDQSGKAFVFSDWIQFEDNDIKNIKVSSTCLSSVMSTIRPQCPAVATSLAQSTSTAVTVVSISTALSAATSSFTIAAPSSSKVLASSVLLLSDLFITVSSTLSAAAASTQSSSPTMSHGIDLSISDNFFTTSLPSAVPSSYFISSLSITSFTVASSESTVLFTPTSTTNSTVPSLVVVIPSPVAVLPISSISLASIVSPVVLHMSSKSSASTSTSSLIVSPISFTSSASSNWMDISVNVDVNCEADGVWEETSPGTTITGTCYSGTVNATRTCYINGTWGSPQCLASAEFLSTLELIYDSPEEGLNKLQDIISQPSDESISTIQIVFLLNEVVISSTGMSLGTNFTTTFLNVSNSLIEMVNFAPYDYDRDVRQSIGSQLLLSLDYLALNSTEASGKTLSTEDSLFLKVFEFSSQSTNTTDDVIGIAVGNNSIALPTDILKNSLNKSVLVGSLFFQNLSNLLSPNDSKSIIISSIISSTIDCPLCPTKNFSDNVTVQLHIKDLSSMSGNTHCVFFDFELRRDLFPTGEWETRGCSSSVDGDIVSCTCNHLTHFAILLSPGVNMAEYGRMNTSILNTIGLVLVPVSLLCMAIVILTYTLFRSLWSIRNYIHTMLCVSLFMAQLVFILGIDKIEEEGLCSAIAVILQYLFLVTFMWMLMEGVVLYITLVTVILYNQKRYIIGFTMASYGIPALYMMLIVPIGYLVGVSDIPGHSHYLYYDGMDLTACWLSYETGFIWSFIVPVIVILVINIGFFIMAIVIMVLHSKKTRHRSKLNFNAGNWLKVCIFLTLVLGITWLVGVLFFKKELLFVAYIMTVFIAGQGILIFVVLVPLSTKVREAYLSCWNSLKAKSKLLTSIPTKYSVTTAATSFTDYSSREKLCEKNSFFSAKNIMSLQKCDDINEQELVQFNSETCGQPVDLNGSHYETSHAEVIAMHSGQNSNSENEKH